MPRHIQPMDQKQLFARAFEHVVAKEGEMNLGTAISCFETPNVDKDDKFALGWAILSMLEQRKDEFDAIQPGLADRMKQKIATDMC